MLPVTSASVTRSASRMEPLERPADDSLSLDDLDILMDIGSSKSIYYSERVPYTVFPDSILSMNRYKEDAAGVRHELCKMKLKSDPERIWISKQAEDLVCAKNELLSQEFLRLMLPYHPETRIAIDFKKNDYYILSEEIPSFQMLPQQQHVRFCDGTYTGLGQIMVFAIFLQEIDFKNSNIGYDVAGRIVKIDGEFCFASLVDPFLTKRYDLTEKTIASLPIPADFYAYHWLDLIKAEIKGKKSEFFDALALRDNPLFRGEVNQAIQKICLLTDVFIVYFVNKYLLLGDDKYIDLLISRCDAFREIASMNASYQAYLATDKAVLDRASIERTFTLFCGVKEEIKPPLVAQGESVGRGPSDKEMTTSYPMLSHLGLFASSNGVESATDEVFSPIVVGAGAGSSTLCDDFNKP